MNAGALYRQIAIGDLLLFCGLATPLLGSGVVDLLIQLNTHWAWPGTFQTSPGSDLVIHLLGALGAGFAWLRLRLESPAQGLRVTIAVKLVATGLFVFGVSAGAPAVFLILAAVDLFQALILLAFSRRG